MTTRQVAEGWELAEVAGWRRLGRPALFGPDGLSANVDNDANLVLGGNVPNFSDACIPLTAITELMSAHADWLKHTAEARKETAT